MQCAREKGPDIYKHILFIWRFVNIIWLKAVPSSQYADLHLHSKKQSTESWSYLFRMIKLENDGNGSRSQFSPLSWWFEGSETFFGNCVSFFLFYQSFLF